MCEEEDGLSTTKENEDDTCAVQKCTGLGERKYNFSGKKSKSSEQSDQDSVLCRGLSLSPGCMGCLPAK